MIFDCIVSTAISQRKQVQVSREEVLKMRWWRTNDIVNKVSSSLTYRPGNNLAISAQRLPFSIWYSNIFLSSSMLQAPLLMSGFKWLCQRSLHCLPILPGIWAAIMLHFLAPNCFTNRWTAASSSADHGPLCNVGFRTFCHRCWHWVSDLPAILCAICFQFFAPFSPTAFLRISSCWVLCYKDMGCISMWAPSTNQQISATNERKESYFGCTPLATLPHRTPRCW